MHTQKEDYIKNNIVVYTALFGDYDDEKMGNADSADTSYDDFEPVYHSIRRRGCDYRCG